MTDRLTESQRENTVMFRGRVKDREIERQTHRGKTPSLRERENDSETDREKTEKLIIERKINTGRER